MIGLLIATHGALGEEILRTAEMILGQQKEALAFGVFPGEGHEQIETKILNALEKFSESEGVLVLADMAGGSPCQLCFLLESKNPPIAILSGVNLPMVLEFFLSREGKRLSEIAEKVAKAGVSGIKKVE